MAAVRAPLYKELLTPALHRRFTAAAYIVSIVCYVEAIIFGHFSSCTRTTSSPIETFTRYAITLNTLQTFAWYFLSAWLFSEVCMWSAPASADLGWISEGKTWERRKLNEAPIYFRSFFITLAALQSAIHLFFDYDEVSLPISKNKTEPASEQPLSPAHPLTKVTILLLARAQRIVLCAAFTTLSGPILYSITIRKSAWRLSIYFAKVLSDVQDSPRPYIFSYRGDHLLQSFVAGLLLLILWETSSISFGAYVAQEPLKIGVPFTSEAKDPNGALLNGLKSKKPLPNNFALQELLCISQGFPTRRKTLFSDIDRPSGPAWSQILTLTINPILAISNRITAFQNPSPRTTHPQQHQPITIETLPRITAPTRQENILATPLGPSTSRGKLESNIASLTKSYGQSPHPAKPIDFFKSQLSESEKYLELARQKLLTAEQQEHFSKQGLLAQYNDSLLRLLRSRIGYPFRHTFSRRVSTVVLGSPYAQTNAIIASAGALSALVQASLKEDPYGRVAKDVPLVIRGFVSAIQAIEGFVDGLQPDWTDVGFVEGERGRRVDEVEEVVGALKMGLKAVVGAFGVYGAELGMGREEMGVARRVAGMGGVAG